MVLSGFEGANVRRKSLSLADYICGFWLFLDCCPDDVPLCSELTIRSPWVVTSRGQGPPPPAPLTPVHHCDQHFISQDDSRALILI